MYLDTRERDLYDANDACDRDRIACEVCTKDGRVLWSGFSFWQARKKALEFERAGIEVFINSQ